MRNATCRTPNGRESWTVGTYALCAAVFCILNSAFLVSPLQAQTPSGEAVYQRRCAGCHERPADGRTPRRETLQNLSSTRILRTLDFGAMMTIAYQLRRDEREAVAGFLGKPGGDPQPRAEAFCRDRSVTVDLNAATRWNGWSPRPDNARFVPAAVAKLDASDLPRLRLKWAFGFDGDISAVAQPTVIGNQIFVGSLGGVVHALRADSGCLQWTFQAAGAIRAAIVATELDGRVVLLFGDLSGWLWDFDTVREYDTVNGVKASGGAVDGPGTVVVGGLVLVNSGYMRFGGLPGNVLLAFAP